MKLKKFCTFWGFATKIIYEISFKTKKIKEDSSKTKKTIIVSSDEKLLF